MAKKEEAKIIFMENEPFAISEHTIKILSNGKESYRNFTCRRVIDKPCPLCMAGNEPRYTGFMSIIDTRGYKSKDKVVPYSRKVFAMSTSVLEWWETVQEASRMRNKTPSGSMFIFKREGKVGEPGVGGIRNYVDNVDLSRYTISIDGREEVIKPFDFEKILYPLGEQALRDAAAMIYSGNNDESSIGSDSDWESSSIGGDSDTGYN